MKLSKKDTEWPNVACVAFPATNITSIIVWVILRKEKRSIEHLLIVYLKWNSTEKPLFWPSHQLLINQIEINLRFLLAQSEDELSKGALEVQWMGVHIGGNIHVKIHFSDFQWRYEL